jgi:hypothetical protein
LNDARSPEFRIVIVSVNNVCLVDSAFRIGASSGGGDGVRGKLGYGNLAAYLAGGVRWPSVGARGDVFLGRGCGHVARDGSRRAGPAGKQPELEEDGVPQTIRYFSRESDLPLTIGILVDTSSSQLHVLELERRASYTFLDQVIREDRDQAFVAHFDFRVEVLQVFSSSRKDLAAALSGLEVPSRFGTLLYDAIRDCSENQMRKRMGRKAFILLSDGGDHRSKTSLGTANRVCAAGGHDHVFHSLCRTA